MKNMIQKLCGVLVLGLLFWAEDAAAARCENFHSTPFSDNRLMCDLMKADGSDAFACESLNRGRCESRCNKLDRFKENCEMNTSCEWNPNTTVHPCREKEHGWEPKYSKED